MTFKLYSCFVVIRLNYNDNKVASLKMDIFVFTSRGMLVKLFKVYIQASSFNLKKTGIRTNEQTY